MGEKVLMKGNEAIGEAAIRSGCRHFFGYPITCLLYTSNTADGTFGLYGEENAENKRSISSSGK